MTAEVIAVDQDVAGKQGSVFAQSATCTMAAVGEAIDAWTGTLSGNTRVISIHQLPLMCWGLFLTYLFLGVGMTARQRRKRYEADEGHPLRGNVSVTGTCTA